MALIDAKNCMLNANEYTFKEALIKGQYGLFEVQHVDKDTITRGLYCYELKYGEDDDAYPVSITHSADSNYFGTLITSIELLKEQEDGLLLARGDFSTTGAHLTTAEYVANYVDEPDIMVEAFELVRFVHRVEKYLSLDAREAHLLFDYLEGHDYVLGRKGDRLFRGDLAYDVDNIRWEEICFSDIICWACDMNEDLLMIYNDLLWDTLDEAECAELQDKLDSLEEESDLLGRLAARDANRWIAVLTNKKEKRARRAKRRKKMKRVKRAKR